MDKYFYFCIQLFKKFFELFLFFGNYKFIWEFEKLMDIFLFNILTMN